jgi:hypothetical protein
VTEYEGSLNDDIEEWSFHDAPRYLRLKAVACIPKLLIALAEDADKFTKNITEAIEVAEQLAGELNAGQEK